MISRSAHYWLALRSSGCTPRGADPAVREVRIALSRDGITWLPIYIAQSLGYYREEGLTISISDVAGLSKGMQALLGRQR